MAGRRQYIIDWFWMYLWIIQSVIVFNGTKVVANAVDYPASSGLNVPTKHSDKNRTTGFDL